MSTFVLLAAIAVIWIMLAAGAVLFIQAMPRHSPAELPPPIPAPALGAIIPCPDCQAPCSECNATGRSSCRKTGCGGAGVIVLQKTPCPRCLKDGKLNRDCPECNGLGEVANQIIPCPVCNPDGDLIGPGEQICPVCNGTKSESTGRVNTNRPTDLSSIDVYKWRLTAPICPRCNGNQQIYATEPAVTPEKRAAIR